MRIFKYLDFNKLEKIQIPNHSVCDSCLNIKNSSTEYFSIPIVLNICQCKEYSKILAHKAEFMLRNCYGGTVHRYKKDEEEKIFYWCRIYNSNIFSPRTLCFSEYRLSQKQFEEVLEFYWNCDFRPKTIHQINREIEETSLMRLFP